MVATHRADLQPDVQLPIGAHNTDDMIVFADSLGDADAISLHQNGFPIILIHRSSPSGYQIPSVTIENKNATRRLVEHLITAHGRKNPFCAGPR